MHDIIAQVAIRLAPIVPIIEWSLVAMVASIIVLGWTAPAFNVRKTAKIIGR